MTRILRTLLAAVAVTGVPAPALAAQQIDTLRLSDALEQAMSVNPMLQAARLRAEAAVERVSVAGAWSDPVLSFGLMNRPVSGFGAGEPMTMNSIQLAQAIPWPGKLGYAEQRARHLAEAELHESDETGLQLVARVRSVYFRLAYIDRAVAVMESTRDLLRDFLGVSTSLYAVGSGLQQDVLQAQVAVARMTEDIMVMQQERVAMAARLNGLLGREVTVPVGALELPDPVFEIPPVDSLIAAAAAARPALAAARARVDAADAGYRAARRELYPDLMVSVAYGQRPQFDDMASLMIGVSIPIWAGGKQLPMRREMEAMRETERSMERDLYNETFARLTELRADAVRAQGLASLYQTSILPQAEAAVQSALSAYRVGRLEYLTLVESEMTVNRYQIESLRLAADFQEALAEMEALVGGEIGGAR